jgi:hypothetical protein
LARRFFLVSLIFACSTGGLECTACLKFTDSGPIL